MHPESLFNTGLVMMFVFSLITFPVLFFVTAPYGRHRRPGWGPEIPDTVGWIVQESPSVVLFAVVFFTGPNATQLVPLLLFALWEAHYVQRTFVFPFLLRGKGRMAPVTTVGLAVLFNLVNASVNAYALSHGPGVTDYGWVHDPRFIAGVALFLVGYSVNRHSDAVLRALRKPGESGYKIPDGGLHRYVASPNYFGEILEWTGFALAAWNLAALSFALFTIANLAPRARSHLRWYREQFPDYPRTRKALIPGLW